MTLVWSKGVITIDNKVVEVSKNITITNEIKNILFNMKGDTVHDIPFSGVKSIVV